MLLLCTSVHLIGFYWYFYQQKSPNCLNNNVIRLALVSSCTPNIETDVQKSQQQWKKPEKPLKNQQTRKYTALKISTARH